MQNIKLIFNACYQIMLYKIDLLGYSICLYNAVVFGIVGSFLLWLFFRLSR